jgi:hypothetical protein
MESADIYISGGEDDKQCTHFDHEYIITSFIVNNKKIYILTNQRYIVAYLMRTITHLF